jgi:hypothetical protein
MIHQGMSGELDGWDGPPWAASRLMVWWCQRALACAASQLGAGEVEPETVGQQDRPMMDRARVCVVIPAELAGHGEPQRRLAVPGGTAPEAGMTVRRPGERDDPPLSETDVRRVPGLNRRAAGHV